MNSDGHIRVYIALRVPEDWTQQCGIDFSKADEARDILLKLFDGWSPEIVEMLRASDDVFLPRPLYTLPPEQAWQSQPNVTLLGDAAHVMPPFTGKGANYAMLDAVELAENLTSEHFPDLASAISAYEQKMLARMSRAISETLASQNLMISADAPRGFQALIDKRMKNISPKGRA